VRVYLITTGVIFGLITMAHGLRVYAEGPRLMKDPLFLSLTALAAGMCAWAFWLLGRSSRSR
jgi:hypothetical protein